MKILVTGCSRSGNTLMANLLSAGFGIPCVVGEAMPIEGTVAKLPRVSHEIIDLLRDDADLRVVFMVRDPRSVIVSRHPVDPDNYWVSPEQWIQANRDVMCLPSAAIRVRFEDLVSAPAATQSRLAQWLGLHVSVPFAQCWPSFENDVDVMRGARPMDRGRLRAWEVSEVDAQYVEKSMAEHPCMAWLAYLLGYDIAPEHLTI